MKLFRDEMRELIELTAGSVQQVQYLIGDYAADEDVSQVQVERLQIIESLLELSKTISEEIEHAIPPF